MNNFLIVILGPTGIGKTDISVTLADHLGCEIISADSRQFFNEMIIGTAVPSEDQLLKARHHFIRFLSVRDYYSASLFESDVMKFLKKHFKENSLAIMTGGSGLYIDAVCNGIDDIPDVDPLIREKYSLKYKEEGTESLRIALKVLDPEYYGRVDLKNHKRIIRALEICETTGRPFSSFLNKQKMERDFRILKIGLERPREELYKRINSRVEEMIAVGLENEALKLYELRHFNSLKCVGYREFFDYFDGKTSREKAIELIKRNTRRFAKRQMTWWAKDNEITWFDADNIQKIEKYINGIVWDLKSGV